jgi:hypothetical protein
LGVGQWQVANLIDDQQPGPQHTSFHHFHVTVLALGAFQVEHQIRGRDEPNLDATLRGKVPQSDRQVGFTGTAGTKQDYVLFAL